MKLIMIPPVNRNINIKSLKKDNNEILNSIHSSRIINYTNYVH